MPPCFCAWTRAFFRATPPEMLSRIEVKFVLFLAEYSSTLLFGRLFMRLFGHFEWDPMGSNF